MKDQHTSRVRWTELLPDAFRARQRETPVAYLPLGLCEPHGHIAALGLDLIKADLMCEEAARRFGGIVAPYQGYQIHESGYHAPWLAEVVGEEDAHMAAVPPHVALYHFLYQLRAYANAGFEAVFALSGHGGGNEHDFRRAAASFESETGLIVEFRCDYELVKGEYRLGHAGQFEISQLMHLAPELIDMSLINRRHEAGSGGRLALDEDAASSTPELGRKITEDCMAGISELIAELKERANGRLEAVTYEQVEGMWKQLKSQSSAWRSAGLNPGQSAAPELSRWRKSQDFDYDSL